MARKIASRRLYEEIPTIIGAGLTEQWYFTHLRDLFNLRIKIRPRFFGREDIETLKKRIEKVLHEGGSTIVVFDADVSMQNEKENRRLQEMKAKYTNNIQVVLCDSLPSIEYWFLLHYQETNRFFKDSSAVVKELQKYIQGFSKNEKFLENNKWVSDMSGDKRLERASQRAKKFGINGESYSNVWKAIERIAQNRISPQTFDTTCL